ncbi:MAG: hypothetical protein DMF00_03885 [Verrucomicrobia bacterium]|nr:MAG: hypothetical protein DMF00_03885 [Verrucomicrobiota bacterium]
MQKLRGSFVDDTHNGRCSLEQILSMDTRIVARILAAVAISIMAVAAEPQPARFDVPVRDSAKAEELAKQLAALSPRVDRNEATLLADCAYATVARLRREYRMFGTPIFNNFLVFHRLRKRGYCYQWTEDLLVSLDALKLGTLELHWGEAYAGTYRENNCLVVTAKGQPFERGMILECWRHFGHLRWNLVPSDEDRYYENTKWAQFVRTQAASKASLTNRGVAFQTRVAPSSKTGD